MVPLQVVFTTTTTLAASPNPAIACQALTLTATVNGSGASKPVGTVTFLNGSAVLGTVTLNAAGLATLSTASQAVGTHSLTAKYAGNASALPSTSAGLAVTVKAQTTTTSLAASPNQVTVGQALSLTASVKGAVSAPAGTVTFLNGSAVLGAATLNASGVATLHITSLAVGGHSLTAKYVGNASALTSTSAGVTVTVRPGS